MTKAPSLLVSVALFASFNRMVTDTAGLFSLVVIMPLMRPVALSFWAIEMSARKSKPAVENSLFIVNQFSLSYLAAKVIDTMLPYRRDQEKGLRELEFLPSLLLPVKKEA